MAGESGKYVVYRRRNAIEKSINSLLGIIEGISIDGAINQMEIGFLETWLVSHQDLREKHPYSELIPLIEEALSDRLLSEDEREGILWLCERLKSSEFQDAIATDLQVLHAVMGGIAADASISEQELRGLSEWLDAHDHLRKCWPYDEVSSIVTSVLADGKIDEKENELLLRLFAEFVPILDDVTITNPLIQTAGTMVGVCAVCPEIEFKGKVFCFTGASSRCNRKEFEAIVRRLGGDAVPTVSGKVDYLVIGADGNPCWMYACYGRKVERAISLRREGAKLMIIHELDFHDALHDVA